MKQLGQWVSGNRRKVGLGVLAVLLVASVAGGFSQTQLKVSSQVPEQEAVRVDGPVRVEFSQELAGGYAATIEPRIAGQWKEDKRLLGVAGVSFVPEKRFQAGHAYTIRIKKLKRQVTGTVVPDIEHTFRVQKPAAIEKMSPAPGAKDVPIQAKFTLTLATANRGVRDLRPSLTPATPLKLLSSDDKTYTWAPVAPLKQGTAYTFTLDDAFVNDPAKRTLLSTPFNTVAQPVITSARTGGYFSPGQNVEIVFDQAMEPGTSLFLFEPSGKSEWANDHTFRFAPSNLKPGTTYSYIVKAGVRSKTGGVIEADRPFTFATNGAVGAGVSPTGGGVNVGTSIQIRFDQAVDHASAESRFRISPVVAGKFSWSGNTMSFKPAGLGYQTGYSYAVAPGVVPAWGLPSTVQLGGSFSTQNQIIKLGVPAYTQQYTMSCEITSLRMLLAYRGISASESDILGRVGYNPRSRDLATNTWDNPNEMYVGFVNGTSWNSSYGVHAGPVAAAARSYGRNATSYFGVSASFIASNIYAGNPVEFWGHIAYQHPDAWNTSSGVVQTAITMHARVVYGVEGSADNPVGFYVNDPWKGGVYYMSAGALIANMNGVPGVSNQAVVVY